jgi:thioredoxin 1
MSGYVTLTGENFEEEVVKSSTPVLIDFWASWCGPCKTIAPFIDQLANEYEGQIKVAKVNVDEEQDLASRHGIASIPMLVVYQNGTIAVQRAGAMPKPEIEKLFKGLL